MRFSVVAGVLADLTEIWSACCLTESMTRLSGASRVSKVIGMKLKFTSGIAAVLVNDELSWTNWSWEYYELFLVFYSRYHTTTGSLSDE